MTARVPPTAALRAIDAHLRACGFEAARVRLVACLDCEVWRIAARARDGRASELSLRVYSGRKRERAPIEAEVAWLRALADTGVHVPRPLADGDGRVIRDWQPDPAQAPRHAVLLAWLGGRMHDRGLTPARLYRVGVLAARLHEASAGLVRAGAISTSRLGQQLDLAAWAGGDRPGAQRLGERLGGLASQAGRRLATGIGALPRDASSWGFIHSDLHPWNLLFVRDVAGAIDFSDCGWGHFAFDLASTLQWLRFPFADNRDPGAGYAGLKAALFDGYASLRPLPPDVDRQVELHLHARLLLTLEWMLDDWPALDARAWGPRFLPRCADALAQFLQGD